MGSRQSEERKYQRLPLRLAAELRFEDGTRYRVMTQDIGLGGAFVLGISLQSRIGRRCSVQLLPRLDQPSERIRLHGRIVHSRIEGTAVAFLGSTSDEYRRFTELMLENAPEPEHLRRELEQAPGFRRDVG